MIMARKDGDEPDSFRGRKPWFTRKLREGFDGARNQKLSVSVTRQEKRTFRQLARLAGMTDSQYLRANMSPDLLQRLQKEP